MAAVVHFHCNKYTLTMTTASTSSVHKRLLIDRKAKPKRTWFRIDQHIPTGVVSEVKPVHSRGTSPLSQYLLVAGALLSENFEPASHFVRPRWPALIGQICASDVVPFGELRLGDVSGVHATEKGENALGACACASHHFLFATHTHTRARTNRGHLPHHL